MFKNLFSTVIRVSKSKPPVFFSPNHLLPKLYFSEIKINSDLQTSQDDKLSEKKSSELRSITNETSQIVFVKGLPDFWKANDIEEYFDKEKKSIIEKVSLIKNRLGKNTGKALITFSSKTKALEFIEKWNNNFVETEELSQKLYAEIFQLKKKADVVEVKHDNKQVYIYNLSFSASSDDLYKFAGEFGEIVNVEMPLTQSNKNKGYAFISFKHARDAQEFLNFAHDKDWMGRKIKIQIHNFKFDTKAQKKQSYSDFIFSKNQTEEEQIKGENINENMKIYEEIMKQRV